MKTILFVYPTLFNPFVGGIERVTDLLAKELIARGYKVLYLHNKRNEALLSYKYPTKIFYFPSENYNDKINVKYYQHFLREHHINIVINQAGNFADSHLYLETGTLNVKTISVLHSLPLLNYDHLSEQELILKKKSFFGYVKLIARLLIYVKIKGDYFKRRLNHFKFLFEHTDLVCLLSRSHFADFKALGLEHSSCKVVSIPNPCSFPINKCNKKKQILYVGRLTKSEKRPDRLLKIWNLLYKDFPDWELVIVGDGMEKVNLEKNAKKMRNVIFCGFQNPLPYYRDASIFCLVSNYEGFPMTLPEAMSCGTIPLAFDSFSALHDIIENGVTGYIIPAFSIKKYAEKLRLLMKNENLREQISLNAMQSVERFSLDKVTDQWEKLFI